MSQQHESSYGKGLAVGLIIGSAVGAAIALLLAPKSGSELRRDIAERSGELYDKASGFAAQQSKKINEYVNEGKQKAEEIIHSTRQQAGSLMTEAETLMHDARSRMSSVAQSGIKDNIARIQDAAQAGADTFRREMRKESSVANDDGGVA